MKDKPKKEYQTPVLTVHGDVTEITENAGAKNRDVPEGDDNTAFPGGSATC
jgi:hypothetical protein